MKNFFGGKCQYHCRYFRLSLQQYENVLLHLIWPKIYFLSRTWYLKLKVLSLLDLAQPFHIHCKNMIQEDVKLLLISIQSGINKICVWQSFVAKIFGPFITLHRLLWKILLFALPCSLSYVSSTMGISGRESYAGSSQPQRCCTQDEENHYHSD